ncbi:hypothetical protein MMC19_003398 [Ptychographa xylographoides]|nr:hypothetical protein [Ptychographa xylographoides]
MAKILAAVTLPINPASSGPTLTIPQIWAGLMIKCKEPQHFVAAMSDCEVVSETATQIMRVITVGKEGMMGNEAGAKLRERIELVEPFKADFYMDNGTYISNIVSVGESPEELYMTFTFEIVPKEEMEAGSQAIKEAQAETEKMALATIRHTIDVIRQMVNDGKV